MSAWVVSRAVSKHAIVHVTPHADLIEHDRTTFGACICGPRVAAVDGKGWLVTHASLDGRELAET